MTTHDPIPARLAALLSDPQRPVQLVIAGKAHPSDQPGQALVRQWIQFINSYGLHGRIVFLVDYDILVAEQLVQGADVWINTPRRPMEASGTSGMKVLVNGGLNLSELDGWWAEAYQPDVGWAIGDGWRSEADPDSEVVSLYDKLERVILPLFYQQPRAFAGVMRSAIALNGSYFNAQRMIAQYMQNAYLTAGSS